LFCGKCRLFSHNTIRYDKISSNTYRGLPLFNSKTNVLITRASWCYAQSLSMIILQGRDIDFQRVFVFFKNSWPQLLLFKLLKWTSGFFISYVFIVILVVRFFLKKHCCILYAMYKKSNFLMNAILVVAIWLDIPFIYSSIHILPYIVICWWM